MVHWFISSNHHKILQKQMQYKSYEREQMLDEESAESLALVYTTGTLKLHII